MTTTTKVASQNTTLKINTGTSASLVWTPVAGFEDFSGLQGGAAAVIDVTDLSSTSKEKLKGVKDEGQLKIDLLYVSGDAGQQAMQANRGVSTAAQFEITLQNGDMYAFAGLVLTFELSAGVDKAIVVASTVEITGDVTFTAHMGS